MTSDDKHDRRREKFSARHKKDVSRTLRYLPTRSLPNINIETGVVGECANIMVVENPRAGNVRRELARVLRAEKRKSSAVVSLRDVVLKRTSKEIESLRHAVQMDHVNETGDVLLTFIYCEHDEPEGIVCVCRLSEHDRERLLTQYLTDAALDEFIATYADTAEAMSEARARHKVLALATHPHHSSWKREKKVDARKARREAESATRNDVLEYA